MSTDTEWPEQQSVTTATQKAKPSALSASVSCVIIVTATLPKKVHSGFTRIGKHLQIEDNLTEKRLLYDWKNFLLPRSDNYEALYTQLP